VGYGSLAWSLRTDPRVSVMERLNARELTPKLLPHVPDLAVVDVSFISLSKVLGAVLSVLGAGYDVLAMVKPQFEVGRGRVGKGGVVRDADVRREALVAVGGAALSMGAAVLGYRSSGLAGPKGNRETFIWLSDPRHTGESGRTQGIAPEAPGAEESAAAREQLERLAREVEP
jgi:23S rRNA (cytidine1920-2'-O)/16S rRNA (cytidine1409-2'-O)-methyltransferase